jgi:ribosomal protein S18 acetylase RimI-like enzyme
MGTLRVASAAVQIPTDDAAIIAGGILPRYAKGQVGELLASAAIIEGDEVLCVVACDVIAVPRALGDAAAQRIEAQCGVPIDNTLITASHTHHAPTTVTVHGYEADVEFCRHVEDAIVEAAVAARRRLDERSGRPNEVEAEMGFALGNEATVGANSRLLMRDGQIAWAGHDPGECVRPTGPCDPDLAVIAFRRPGGRLAALLFNHSTHNIGGHEGEVRSPGFYGLAAQEVGRKHRTTALFLPGALGSTHNLHVGGPEATRRVSAAVEEAVGRLRFGLSGPVVSRRKGIEYTVREFDEEQEDAAVSRWCERWFPEEAAEANIAVFRAMRRQLAPRQGEKRRTWLQAIVLGDVALACVPGEMFAKLGLEIRRRSPFRHTFVVGLANDEIGYIPDADAYDLGGYQLWTGFHSVLPRGAGEGIVDEVVGMLGELHAEAQGGRMTGSENVEVRTLTGGDGRALQRFYNELSPESRRLFRPLGWSALLSDCEQIARDAAEGRRFDVVAWHRDAVVGWAFITPMDHDVPVLGIGVADGFQNRGIGKQLMQAVTDEGRRRGRSGIVLTVVDGNDRARLLYERFGFRTIGTHRGDDGLDYLEMEMVY